MTKCRTCGSSKWSSKDICPVCGAGMPQQTLRMRGAGKAISATTKHGFHAPMVRTQYSEVRETK